MMRLQEVQQWFTSDRWAHKTRPYKPQDVVRLRAPLKRKLCCWGIVALRVGYVLMCVCVCMSVCVMYRHLRLQLPVSEAVAHDAADAPAGQVLPHLRLLGPRAGGPNGEYWCLWWC